MSDMCSVHQVIDKDGKPRVSGSQVRLPNGDVIPNVLGITIEANPENTWWDVTVKLRAVIGEPIKHREMTEQQKEWINLSLDAIQQWRRP